VPKKIGAWYPVLGKVILGKAFATDITRGFGMTGHGEWGGQRSAASANPNETAFCEPASMDTSHNARIRAFPKLFVHAADRARHLAIPLRSVAKRNVA